MTKTTDITLGGKTYKVQAFTLDDLEEISSIVSDKATAAMGLKVLKIALRNSDPPLTGDAGKVRVDSIEELNAATEAILKLAGIELKKADPTEAAPTAVAA